ncbi:hypothetical protein [Lichenibacterium ramalinae]|uniref:Uncharacterized protein n=1 Tax=Lichenibacterium ramalinae TaxID=2316527 RepID=A0A4V1RIU9_9HYPH|nr:hypothetical protein [Lichenibacterium ramalinae]RYB05727.1 hypothetical protein D3272_09085 [Lichenibacterium ramalinae]
MPVNQRPQWTAVEIAAHAMEATSLSQITLPEVKRMAARILDEKRNAPSANQTDPNPNDERELRQTIEDEYVQGSKRHSGRLD